MIKDRDGNVMIGARTRARTGRWTECFEELMDEENEKERRVEELLVLGTGGRKDE